LRRLIGGVLLESLAVLEGCSFGDFCVSADYLGTMCLCDGRKEYR
jgi:hypothetical protein